MSFRDAIKTGGGGFLNNVDGEITGYEFSNRFKGEKKDGPNTYFVPTIKIDGSDKEVDQHLYMGSLEYAPFVISDDGQEITMEDGSPVDISGKLPFGRLMSTLVEKGFDPDDELLPNLSAGEPLNLSAIVGQRFRFKQEVDKVGTEKRGQRVVKDPKTGKVTKYDRTNTVIDAVLGATETKSRGKTAGKPVTKGKKNNDEDPDNEEAVEAKALEVTVDALGDGPVMRKSLSLPITKRLLKLSQSNKPFAEAVKAKALDEDWQDAQDAFEVKKGQLKLTE